MPIDPEQGKVVILGAPGSHLTVKLNPRSLSVSKIVYASAELGASITMTWTRVSKMSVQRNSKSLQFFPAP